MEVNFNEWNYIEKNSDEGLHLLYKTSQIESEPGANIFTAINFDDADYVRAVIYIISKDHPIQDGDTQGVANSTFKTLHDAREWVDSIEFEIQDKWGIRALNV